jgi:hypothetical protein
MAEVSGLDIPPKPATLRGYRRLKVKGEVYPGIIPDGGGSVTGVLYRDIDQAAWSDSTASRVKCTGGKPCR